MGIQLLMFYFSENFLIDVLDVVCPAPPDFPRPNGQSNAIFQSRLAASAPL